MRCGKIGKLAAAFLVVIYATLCQVSAADRLIPGGMPFGVRLYCDGVLVVGVGDVETAGGRLSPAKDAGIRPRDVITGINGERIASADDVVNAVSGSSGEKLSVSLRRGGGELTVDIRPVESSGDGKFRAGLWIRDSTAGIGTITFIDPETGAFAGLGHGICDSDTGELMPLKRGVVLNVAISGVVRGQSGTPGELKGYFSSGKIGSLLGNTECGVFGVLAELPPEAMCDAISVAASGEVVEGGAELYCTTDSGGIGRYAVQISNIDRSGRQIKNFVVTVTDEALLGKTGGIVQGMSGSPIIQNGKLIGAVTHVCVNL